MNSSESRMVIIFGATGDLTKRKLIPALYHMLVREQLPENSPIVCLGRRPYVREEFFETLELERFVEKPDQKIVLQLFERVEYLQVDLQKTSGEDFYAAIERIRKRYNCSYNKLVYLALSTTMFQAGAELLKPLTDSRGWLRVVFEKPFGQDLASAVALNEAIKKVLKEEDIYRVDHYLGKELVQNILTMRFANPLFAHAWCHEVVDHVQISVCESLGVEKRAGYYDNSGAVRDMVQNHLLQLLSFVAMEPPVDDTPESLRDSAAAVLQNLRPVGEQDVVLGQYGEGRNGIAYLQEEGVAENSSTETYCALRAWVDSPRWQGVPFYLRTGKRLSQRYADIKIVFKKNGQKVLGATEAKQNMIVLRIQPDEGMSVAFNVQKPGKGGQTESVLMDFCHHCYFGPNTPEAYESILRYVSLGDHSVFPRWDWIEASWQYVDGLREKAAKPVCYPTGSLGPEEADALLEADGRQWINDQAQLQRFLVTAG